MLRSIAVTAILSLALAAQANDGVELTLRSKALASAGSNIKSEAPLAVAHDPLAQVVRLEEREQLTPRADCEFSAKDLCYDLAERRIVYRAARNYMPDVAGLKAENISLRHNRVVFKYSFR